MLEERLKNVIDDIKATRKIQPAISNHFDVLYSLMKIGHTRLSLYSIINGALDFNINEGSFINAMDRAKKKWKNKNIDKPMLLSNQLSSIQQSQENNEQKTYNWDDIHFIKNESLINDLEKENYTPDDVISWNVVTERGVRNKLTELKLRKNKEKFRGC